MATIPFTGTKWGASGATGTPGGEVNWSFNLTGASIYAFDRGIMEEAARALVRAAFDLWESVANIDFTEVFTGGAPIQLGWDTFDGAGGKLGEATWTYQNGTTIQSEIAFDVAERWSPFAGQGPSFFLTAVHEIGHAIGLGHTDDPTSIMYPYLSPSSTVSAADVAAIQSLYGAVSVRPLPITGTAGNDLLTGSSGNDVITAREGSDIVYGNDGADEIYGGEGSDTLSGNRGDDTISGNQGNDLIHGGQGNDTLYGGRDNDVLSGDRDDDRLFGDLGDDSLNGGQGRDVVRGGQGNDEVRGGQDNDFVFGDLGDDRVWGDFGNDVLTGGGGRDTFFFAANSGNDVITDFSRADGDRLDLQGQTYTVADTSGAAVVTLSGGGTITLTGVTSGALDAGAFV